MKSFFGQIARVAIASAMLTTLAFDAAEAADKVVRVGYQKYGTFLLLKARGLLEKKLAPLGFDVAWTEFPGGPQLLEALNVGALDFGITRGACQTLRCRGAARLCRQRTAGAARRSHSCSPRTARCIASPSSRAKASR